MLFRSLLTKPRKHSLQKQERLVVDGLVFSKLKLLRIWPVKSKTFKLKDCNLRLHKHSSNTTRSVMLNFRLQ